MLRFGRLTSNFGQLLTSKKWSSDTFWAKIFRPKAPFLLVLCYMLTSKKLGRTPPSGLKLGVLIKLNWGSKHTHTEPTNRFAQSESYLTHNSPKCQLVSRYIWPGTSTIGHLLSRRLRRALPSCPRTRLWWTDHPQRYHIPALTLPPGTEEIWF